MAYLRQVLLLMQHTPKPEAQLPEAVPLAAEHSEFVRHVPL